MIQPPEDEVEYYLEAHVTIEPIFDEARERASQIARDHGFKLAKLLMQKERDAVPERSNMDTFMTGHSRWRSDITTRTQELIQDLKENGYKVWRYKIEDTICDSRIKDEWGVL